MESHSYEILLALGVLAPFVCFWVLVFWGPKLGKPAAGWLTVVLGMGVPLALATYVLIGWLGEIKAGTAAELTAHAYRIQWAAIGTVPVTIGVKLDSLTVAMYFMVAFIAFWIFFFSIGYMSGHSDEVDGQSKYHRFFAYLSLFGFSMLGLVVSSSLLFLFVFWELVGLCSYLLIGFYFDKPFASAAAVKAFVTNRVGDFGFLIGLMLVFFYLGTLDLDQAAVVFGEQYAHHTGVFASTFTLFGWSLATVMGVGLFCGAMGKSAQFPLHVWLPDAMAGPTPVSALIHAATMVAAGVYLVARVFRLMTPDALMVIAVIGCLTLTLMALIAIVQIDIKKCLAYSTLSQLGYMIFGMGCGAWIAALFHLITHAFFKSMLFLCSGQVIEGCHHEQDMRRMGGLRKKMPVTCWTFFVGVLAISGAGIAGVEIAGQRIGLGGFFSKDEILAVAYVRAFEWDDFHKLQHDEGGEHGETHSREAAGSDYAETHPREAAGSDYAETHPSDGTPAVRLTEFYEPSLPTEDGAAGSERVASAHHGKVASAHRRKVTSARWESGGFAPHGGRDHAKREHTCFSGVSFSPGGALDCSHGWSPAQPDATRGVQAQEWTRPGGAAAAYGTKPPPPLSGRARWGVRFHGLRFARLAASGAPPVATILGPSGTVFLPPILSQTRYEEAAAASRERIPAVRLAGFHEPSLPTEGGAAGPEKVASAPRGGRDHAQRPRHSTAPTGGGRYRLNTGGRYTLNTYAVPASVRLAPSRSEGEQHPGHGATGGHPSQSERASIFTATDPLPAWMFYLAIFSAYVTPFYMMRCWWMTFMGKPRDEHVYAHAHESPLMYVPLVVLSVGTCVAGYALFRPLIAHAAVHATDAALVLATDGEAHTAAIAAAHHWLHFGVGGAFVVGFALAIAIYARGLRLGAAIKRAAGPLAILLEHKYYFDEVYDLLAVRGCVFVARVARFIDTWLVDLIFDTLAAATERLAAFSGLILDNQGVDGVINGIASSSMDLANAIRKPQTGRIRNYVLFATLVATVILTGIVLFAFGSSWGTAAVADTLVP